MGWTELGLCLKPAVGIQPRSDHGMLFTNIMQTLSTQQRATEAIEGKRDPLVVIIQSLNV
jgi:hypothetical protein